MPESDWVDRKIADCLEDSFAGEWGLEPNPANAVVLRATDIDDSGHVVGAGAPRSIPFSKLRAKQLRDGDVLLEGSGGGPGKPVGRVALFEADNHDGPAICSNFFKTLRPKRSVVDQRFLWRKLGWFYTQSALLAFQQQTTGIINLKFAEYLDAQLKLPADVDEQAKIAEVLDTLDTTIRQAEAIIEKLKQVKQGLLHDLLTRGIDANGELRPPPSEAPHLYKASPLGWIPREWEVGGISCYLDSDDGIKPGPFGSSIKKEFYTATGFKVFGQEQVISGDQEIGDYFIPLRKFQELQDFAVASGDVLISLVGTIGKVLVLREPLRPGLINPRLMRLRPNKHKALPEFVGLLVSSNVYARQVMANAGGGTMPVINKRIVSRIQVPVLPLSEQSRIWQAVVAADCRIDAEEQAVGKLAKQREGLMDDLLTGRVRVTPLLQGSGQSPSEGNT